MRLIIVSIMILFSRVACSQNLIANGSFEDINICEEHKATCSPSAWFYARQKLAQGYFSTTHIPGTIGDRYISITVAQPDSGIRQYWETMLLCNLQAGKMYKASIKLAAQEIGPNLHDIGFYFTDHFIFSWEDTLLQPANYLSFLDAKVKKLKYNWVELEKEFVADRGYQFLIIGNFSKQSNHEILESVKLNGNYSFLIDDVSVVPMKQSDCDGYEKRIDSLYAVKKRHRIEFAPIPAVDTMQIPQQPAKIDTLVINNILFAFNSFILRDEAELDKVKSIFTKPGIKKIHVTGFTDDAGTESYNKSLSEKRANEIARLLSLKFGIPAYRIEAEGKGISLDYADKKQNRRVEIYIYH